MGGLTVNVKQGWLRGTREKSSVGGSYISFNGIPFAAPPVGNLRFADPRPPLPWTGVRDASKEGPKCIQFDLMTSTIVGEEDCLYLNVATTSLQGSRPVMVWIHGGAFIIGDGSSAMYSPDYLMKTDIVFVSIQYRLGVLGFLQLDHEVMPGNAGLKDQVAALKWVKENISQFGGDSNNITIFGESAGSASVHYHLVSPLSKGLFHKAIMQSGVILNPWVITPPSVETAHRLAALLGKETTDVHEIVEHLRTIPALQLIQAELQVPTPEDKIRFLFPFRPSIDDKSEQPFLPKNAKELAVKGIDVPVIIGYNSHEGLFFLMGFVDETLETVDKNFEVVVTENLIAENPSKISEVASEIRNFYFKDKSVTRETLDEYVQCYGDLYFVNGVLKTVEYQQKKPKTPTYLYKFTRENPQSMGKLIFKVPLKGAAHADELQYLFHTKLHADLLKFEPNSTEQKLSDAMVKMWTDFAKTGNPTPQTDNDLIPVKWSPVTRTSKNYLEIGDELSARANPDEEVSQLFNRISDIVKSQ
ncbi:juvenile hormone esterase-like isoform X1 [Neodiprion pinetum]|uniref:juvenile hormone esterase-like isoform X1 n=1 Tax=Neodiprion pinetum TaxID=441929 RepID=UPI001EDDC728|nr:juvenile hormone esterase-like isoform X1 [Neodiprion pinetum]